MPENIKKADAEKTLLSSYGEECKISDSTSLEIESILNDNHKTYKYILVNGLLAKATNEKINALALQAGSDLEGAYDARSLCHNVLVPFEREFLHNSLGGSNEPFLNKPARFTHLSETNAVRKGNDKKILKSLINIFNSIKTSQEAKLYLACALKALNKIIKENEHRKDSQIKFNPTLIEIYAFIYDFISESFEGETVAILVGALEKIYHNKLTTEYKVVAHKVNQSGASSKEIGDIDIFKDDKYFYSIEVKDKRFTSFDLEHAMTKMMNAGSSKGLFIYGPKADFDEHLVKTEISIFQDKGFIVLLQDIYTYSKSLLFKLDLKDKQEFIDAIFETASEMNCKTQTKDWIQKLLTKLKWK